MAEDGEERAKPKGEEGAKKRGKESGTDGRGDNRSRSSCSGLVHSVTTYLQVPMVPPISTG